MISASMNVTLMLYLILALWLVNGAGKIALGLAGSKKSQEYNLADVFDGILSIVIVLMVVMT